MRRLATVLVTLMALAAPAFAGMPGATPAAPGSPLFVQLRSIEGLPLEPNARRAFLQGFRMTFAENEFALASGGVETGAPIAGEVTANRFRLLEGSPSEDAWSLQLVIGTPPLVVPAKPKAKKGEPEVRRNANTLGRASRGLTLVFMVLSPQAVKADARPIPVRLGLVFPDSAAQDGVGERVSSGGYQFPWAEAGHVTGLLALELLHQGAGEMREKDRVFLGPGVLRKESGR